MKRSIATYIFIAYSAILIKVMVFKTVQLKTKYLMLKLSGHGAGEVNFLPFKTILPYLRGEHGWLIAILELVGNIALLVPIGFLFPFICRRMTWKRSLALAVAVSLAIEGMQVVLRVGIFDIDDVILNALGVMIGYWVLTMFAKKRSSLETGRA
jgi:glycopeptide antibiotics resistance protein